MIPVVCPRIAAPSCASPSFPRRRDSKTVRAGTESPASVSQSLDSVISNRLRHGDDPIWTRCDTLTGAAFIRRMETMVWTFLLVHLLTAQAEPGQHRTVAFRRTLLCRSRAQTRCAWTLQRRGDSQKTNCGRTRSRGRGIRGPASRFQTALAGRGPRQRRVPGTREAIHLHDRTVPRESAGTSITLNRTLQTRGQP